MIKQVTLDIDDCDLSRIPSYAKVVSVAKSTNGGCHALVEVPAPDLPCIDAVIEYALGGDKMRAVLNFIRCANGVPYGDFFDRKGIACQ